MRQTSFVSDKGKQNTNTCFPLLNKGGCELRFVSTVVPLINLDLGKEWEPPRQHGLLGFLDHLTYFVLVGQLEDLGGREARKGGAKGRKEPGVGKRRRETKWRVGTLETARSVVTENNAVDCDTTIVEGAV